LVERSSPATPFHNGLDAVLYILFAVSVIIVGGAGTILSHREGRYRPLGDESRADVLMS
jgi:hypothetical protein